MYCNRRSRLITVLLALMSLLFMQFAVAGYVCPAEQLKLQSAPAMPAMVEAAMPCAASMQMSMDDAQPNLCQAYCHADSQSAYKYQIPVFLAVDALPTAPALQLALLPVTEAPLPAPYLRRTIAPPLAIRHCCFRL